MNGKIPYTPLSTRLSGSARETEIRLKHIFSGPKKRPPALFLALVFSACVLCGNLVSCQEAEPESPPPAEAWVDYWIIPLNVDWEESAELEPPEYPGVTFRWTSGSVSAVKDGETAELFRGMPIWNVFLCDLNGDGLRELCATVSYGSGLVDSHVVVYDYAAGTAYTLWDRGIEDYALSLEEGRLQVTRAKYHGPAVSTGGLALTEDGALVMTDEVLFPDGVSLYHPYDPYGSAADNPGSENRVLLSLEAPLADGRTLTLDAVGKDLNEYNCSVREVLVYDGDTLLQTVSVREVTEEVWAEEFYGYTECWSPEAVMETLDLNFDGNTDFGLFGWIANNTIPYYYWQWNGEQYQYSCTLQGAEVHPETGEVSSEYKWGWGGAVYQRDYYRPDGDGYLYLVRQERERIDFPNWDGDRGSAIETWVPREGAVIRPGGAEQNEEDFVLIRREIPVYEINSDNTVSCFTEIWELKDGQMQMTSRDKYIER